MGKLLKTYLMPHPPIMLHEIGRGEEQRIKNTVQAALDAAVEVAELKPDTIVIVVPPHGPAFSDAMSITTGESIGGNLGRFGADELAFDYTIDSSLVDIIVKKSEDNEILTARIDKALSKKYKIPYELDHGALVPLYFIDKKYKNFKLVHITYGILPNEELYHFGRLVREAIEESNSNAVIITSGDLSHRLTPDAPAGYNPMGERFDRQLVEMLGKPDVEGIMDMDRDLVECAGECGYRSIIVMLGCLDGIMVEGKTLSYEGPFGVGYCISSYEVLDSSPADTMVDKFYKRRIDRMKDFRNREDEYVRLARESLEYHIKTGGTIKIPDNLPNVMLKEKAGVFVSIKKHNQLRGCIGTIEGVYGSIAEEIIHNAISSGTNDPRFYPVDEDELDDLEYSVDVLGKAEPIESKSQLDPKRYGVIVRTGSRSGLLLPNLEGVDTVDNQVNIALDKAGIGKNEKYSMERFEVIRHK